MNAQWSAIRAKLQKTLQPGIYKVWISPLCGEVDGAHLRLTASTDFVADWVRERLSTDIERAAAEVLGSTPILCIEAQAEAQPAAIARPCAVSGRPDCQDRPQQGIPSPTDTSPRPVLFSAQASQIPASEQLCLPYALPSRPLPWRYGFDGFVVGPCNELAHAAARSMTRDSAAVNTLFLNSAPGLGKTHLTQAVGQAVCHDSNRAHPRVEYLTAEEFSSCFVQAMKARDIERFKARFRDLDMLLLEDVEFLQRKEKMQDEVLSTIKTLQLRGSRIILTSSFAPRDLRDLDSQLVSRFCSGFLAGMEKPDLATRRRILQEKAALQETSLPEAVLELLAERVTSDVRQLESCLCNLILKARLLGRSIATDLAHDVLMHYVSDMPLRGMDAIIARVCEGFGLSAPQLRSRNRRQNYVVARNTVFFLARKHTDLSLQEIGDHFGRRHSTVIKGIAAIERELRRETPLGRQVAATLARIEG
ncbi:MAG: chromosomal replication initiator protein DnaA [Deltaproteobacteria bacterium]|jgi:chromosomal replication initiator protein|nr:chromosomal replication initiator protein DnaA [Deltaproteobacteria bacterium]